MSCPPIHGFALLLLLRYCCNNIVVVAVVDFGGVNNNFINRKKSLKYELQITDWGSMYFFHHTKIIWDES